MVNVVVVVVGCGCYVRFADSPQPVVLSRWFIRSLAQVRDLEARLKDADEDKARAERSLAKLKQQFVAQKKELDRVREEARAGALWCIPSLCVHVCMYVCVFACVLTEATSRASSTFSHISVS